MLEERLFKEKGEIHEAVLFLRIEPTKTKDKKKAKKYSLRLDVKSRIELPVKGKTEPKLVVEINNTLSKTLYDFSHFRKRISHIRIFGETQSLNQLIEMEKNIGVGVYHTFFPGNIRKTFEDFMNLLYHRKLKRLTLVISSRSAEILNIPFEMMRKEKEAEPVILSYNDFHLVHTIETRLERFQLTSLEPLAPPLRMLFVAALPVDLPEEQRLLELEKEQELLIEALGPLITEKKVLVEFLDIATLDEIEKSLQAGEHHILHFSGHGVYLDLSQQKSGVLYLEDEEGKTVKVTGKELARRLKTYSSLRMVVLSACESAHSEDYGVAGALISGGIPTVLGMRYEVSDEKAIRFTSQFYTDICTGKPLSHAMFNSRKAIYEYEKEKIAVLQKDKIESMVFLEWMTPFLYQNQDILQLIDYSKKSIDTQYFFQKPINLIQGGKYVGRGFIGRRKEILKLHQLFKEGKRSVCIYGQGGLGKTTLAIRFADNFENGAYKIIQFRNEISEETILARLAKEASRYLGEEIVELVQSPDYDSIDKLNVLMEQFLSRYKIIILFDNFEENQRKSRKKKIYQREICSPRLKLFLSHLCQHLGRFSYILFTTRYLFPKPQVATLNLGEMQFSDTFKLLSRYDNLVQLPTDQKRLVHENLGGNPHTLGLLEKYIGIQGIRWESIIQKFQETKNKEINHDLLLDMLWNQLTGDEQIALMGASVFRDLTAAEGLIAVTGQSNEIVQEAMTTLNSLSLLYMEEEQFQVHRLTATFVQNVKMGRKQVLEYHYKASRYFLKIGIRNGKDKKDNIQEIKRFIIKNVLEARWHYLEAEEWNRAAEITINLGSFLRRHGYPQVSLELFKEMEEKEVTEENQSLIFQQMGLLYQHFSNYDEALKQYQKSIEIMEKIGNIKGVSYNLNNIGVIHHSIGNYDMALTHFQKSMEIKEKIGDIKGVSDGWHNLGAIYEAKGEYDEALKQYQKAKEISEKISDIKGVSDSLYQIGTIYHLKSDYDAALKHYQESREIKDKIGDINSFSDILNSIGAIYTAKGDYDQALEQYQKSLEIKEKMEDIRGISNCLHNIGNIYYSKEDYNGALRYYQKSMEMNKKIGDIRGISYNLYQIGMIFKQKDDFDEALKQYQKSMEISQKIQDIKGVSVNLHQIGMIFQEKGDYNAALTHYIKALKLYVKIRDIVGAANSLVHLGILYFKMDEFTIALHYLLKALIIYSKTRPPNGPVPVNHILKIREKIPEKQFKDILMQHKIPPEVIDMIEKMNIRKNHD